MASKKLFTIVTVVLAVLFVPVFLDLMFEGLRFVSVMLIVYFCRGFTSRTTEHCLTCDASPCPTVVLGGTLIILPLVLVLIGLFCYRKASRHV